MEKVWYQIPVKEVIQALETGAAGLSAEEVARRQQQYGLNKLPEGKHKSLLEVFFRQFLNPLIYVLLAAAAISMSVGDFKDALFILAVIFLNAVLGTWQESKAEKQALALRSLVKIKSRVRRQGKLQEVDAQQLVPGDIVLLESGMKVPCDIRLAEVNELAVEEALLTGESLPVQKQAGLLTADAPAIGDRTNMAFAATTVLKGRAWGIATGTAIQTEIGKIADSLATTDPERPPLLQRMDSFSKTISQVVLGVCLVLGLIGWWRGMQALEIFFFMVAVAVSAIPEGLPVALTVVLAIGTRRMAQRHVIVRKLPAVEGLGSCTMIASDKTGTLTMDQQSVRFLILPDGQQLEATGQGYNGEGQLLDQQNQQVDFAHPLVFRLVQAASLCNEGSLLKTPSGWEYSGDAVDVALQALTYKAGQTPDYFQQGTEVVKMVPYESENKYSGVFYWYQGLLQFVMKGAFEVLLPRLGETDRVLLATAANELADQGYRVLALAGAPADNAGLDQPGSLQLIGIIGLIDPLRAEVPAAIRECQRAGIEVAMVTGDHPATALAIARQLGIAATGQEVITGQELAAIRLNSPETFSQQVSGKRVFARVAPLQKKEIVEALKDNNHFVAVTGDGANDAPALKAAHIGIAMGGGTDLAKDTASIIVTDNNFASIAAGVEEGRFTYTNLRNIIYLLISTGAAELLLVALTLLVGLPLPFIAVQLLWLNLVTNGIQHIGLAFEKGNPLVMQMPPRKPDEGIFDQLMVQQILVSAVTMAGLCCGLWFILVEIQQMEQKHARTILVMLMVLLENFHVLNCRSETQSLFRLPLKNNYFLLISILLAQGIHITASYIPFLAGILQLEPILFHEWIRLLPTAAIILIVMEIFKWIRSKDTFSGTVPQAGWSVPGRQQSAETS